jgi:carbonic anhydrase
MSLTLRTLGPEDVQGLEEVRGFFKSYAAWLGVDLSYQGMAEEMAALPGAYGAPGGRLFLAELDGKAVGCVGVRAAAGGACELKRLYVAPEARNRGAGRALVVAAIHAARELGHRRLLVDTQPAMRIALRLYRELGFGDAPATAHSPQDGTLFLSLDLQTWSEETAPHEDLVHLFDYNREWARRMHEADPGYFDRLAKLQSPEYLWIGCSDSRVPANQIVGLLPGEVFVHRNIANLVVHSDLNCLSVIQFAVEFLKVQHIMVVGHYGCGGVVRALDPERSGLVDVWLRHLEDVNEKHQRALAGLTLERKVDRLCELNVLEQAVNVCKTSVVRDAWKRGQHLTVHGWIYGLKDGLMRDLGFRAHGGDDLAARYELALTALSR